MKNRAYFAKALNGEQAEAVRELQRKHIRERGVFYKIDPCCLTDSGTGTNHILYYGNGALKGYMTVDCPGGDDEIEAAAIADGADMFYEMRERLLQEAHSRKAKRILFINDRNDALMADTLKAGGPVLDATEYRMDFDRSRFAPAALTDLVLRQATEEDTGVIERLRMQGQESSDGCEEEADASARPPSFVEQSRVAELDGEAVGTIKIDAGGGTYGIYGFSVDEGHQGRGIGREMLTRVLLEIMKAEYELVYLYVSSENPRAQKLYEAVGFCVKAVFDYYVLSCPAPRTLVDM